MLIAGADNADGPVDSPGPSTGNATACSPSPSHSQDFPAAEDGTSVPSPVSAQGRSAQHATPASQQAAQSSQHLGLSAYGSGATNQGSIRRPTFSPAAISVSQRRVTPHFREMQVNDAQYEREFASQYPASGLKQACCS